ncbi:MAG: response regulator transcription factor [Chloroflexi bacterium]|nr:response regulator transcription factor [Chloroflexota bacterium]
MIRVLIADDHQLVRKGLVTLLSKVEGIQVVGEASNGLRAVEMAASLLPDVVLLDMAMPGLNGLRAVELIRAKAPNTQIVVLSMYSDETLVRDALGKGARGYVLKHSSHTDLVHAIRAVSEGKTFLSREISPPPSQE